MVAIHTEERRGVKLRYIEGQEGIRVYLLPNVPMHVGKIPAEKNFDLEAAVSKFPEELQERARKIGKKYAGRQLDAISILLYAKEQEKFEDYERRLNLKLKNFKYIHPDLMMARTDVTAFFMRLYADLGIAPVKEAEIAERQQKEYGAGVVVLIG